MLSIKLIACANICPEIQSVYLSDDDEIKESSEVFVFLKTMDENLEKCVDYISANHPYKTAFVASIDAKANSDYEKWMLDHLQKGSIRFFLNLNIAFQVSIC